jgi:thioesterase domain-containing protein
MAALLMPSPGPTLPVKLGPDQPFYALERPDLNGPPLEDDSVESLAIAVLALADIRTVQPHGPYHLAGHCFGGMVMLEVAQKLRAEGETVALLALLDAYAPEAITPAAQGPHLALSHLSTA